MQIASMGPMVIVPDDDKLDHELESRRIRLEKAKAGSAHPSGLDQEVGETLDDGDTREGLERFFEFLKKVKDQDKNKDRDKKDEEVEEFSTGGHEHISNDFDELDGRLEEISPTSGRKKSHSPSIRTMKNCMIFHYEKAKTTEEDLHLKGLYFDKAA
ncbi:MAG: hypothetical protein IPL83_19595 [Bdellovibrionales bacterium]|nr:hypothetical protein [Bdellovibrionales bacterium]